jgi:hypothetical protein
MATIGPANLTLTTVGANTTIRVQYNVTFSAFERFLAANGLVFQERIAVFGVDPPGSTTGTNLVNFPSQNLTLDGMPLVRDRSLTVPRLTLNEDPAPGDQDEIRCRITIVPVNLPTTVEKWSDQEVLLGP